MVFSKRLYCICLLPTFRMVEIYYGIYLLSTVKRRTSQRFTDFHQPSKHHQEFQVPKMEGFLNLLIKGWVFPFISLTYSLYGWVSPFLHRYLKFLVNISVPFLLKTRPTSDIKHIATSCFLCLTLTIPPYPTVDGRIPVTKPCKQWDKLPTSTGDRRISSINRYHDFPPLPTILQNLEAVGHWPWSHPLSSAVPPPLRNLRNKGGFKGQNQFSRKV